MKTAPWQRAVLDNALAALAEGRLAHALLLIGPPHMGKLAVADALARRLLCSSPGADGLACGTCRSCTLYAAKTHGDIQRVTFEPNDKGDKLRTEITVDQIRRLGQWFSLTPQLGGAQVALIEPADAMNVAAANALLKTLEEPSTNRFLLIVTSKPGRLPATIRSRCQRLEFRIPAREDAMAWLRSEGLPEAEIGPALDAARGQPGLAADWIAEGGLAVRREVLTDLNALATGKAGPVETAQRWLGDEHGELRLRFAADLALDAAGRFTGAVATARGGLTVPGDFTKLSAWFDAINRTREQLRAPIRNDLVLAGLLREWRTMFP
jgi:DNA polymerase III subunit delta'